ncbi:MAG TPA: class I SAM-dependent methyltransferase [Thermomicrobiales bacterium]|nr:class I SAM-dependent methyltransferase [Thermomicrobiales bacterium]
MMGETAVQRHDRMMREERDQAERLRTDQGTPPDMWKGRTRTFAVTEGPEPPVVSILAGLVDANARVIDVGAGGGRITIPLARRVREVIAVEPSAGMREELKAGIEEMGIGNIRIVPSSWSDADVDPADMIFAAHVTYGVPRIEPFLRKLDARATRVAALVSFEEPAQHVLAPFWKAVYGEDRLRLPVRAEVVDVLRELGADPQEIPVEVQPVRSFGTPDEAFASLRGRLFIGEGTEAEQRLRDAIPALTVERDGEVWPREAAPNRQSVIWWRPGQMANPD